MPKRVSPTQWLLRKGACHEEPTSALIFKESEILTKENDLPIDGALEEELPEEGKTIWKLTQCGIKQWQRSYGVQTQSTKGTEILIVQNPKHLRFDDSYQSCLTIRGRNST